MIKSNGRQTRNGSDSQAVQQSKRISCKLDPDLVEELLRRGVPRSEWGITAAKAVAAEVQRQAWQKWVQSMPAVDAKTDTAITVKLSLCEWAMLAAVSARKNMSLEDTLIESAMDVILNEFNALEDV